MSSKYLEPIWHIELAVIIAIVLQFVLTDQLNILPKFLIGGFELALLVGLHHTYATMAELRSRARRLVGISLTAIVTVANLLSFWFLFINLIYGSLHLNGQQLIVSAINIYITNIIIFGLWYWQLDGGGPGGRGTHQPPVDFLFPQMTPLPTDYIQKDWRPTYFDYLYISISTATAFSATDAMPLTHRAKLLMSVQAVTALLTIALVVSRAITILG